LAVILDTNAVSALFEGDRALASLLTSASRHELPTIVIGEYRYGLMRSRHKRALSALLEELIRESNVLPIDVETTEHYAIVRERLRANGHPLPENDVWISALALQHDLEVVSRDNDFDHVIGLRRRSW
jgi:tRNA(fMet)-specific endonuclease VapC